jgi:hypothetical protein
MPYLGEVLWLMPLITATWEPEIKRTMIRGHPRENVNEVPPQPISQAWRVIPMIPATWEAQAGGSLSEASPEQKFKTIPDK